MSPSSFLILSLTGFPIQCLLAPFSFYLWTGFLIQCLLAPGFFNLLNVIKSHCPPIHCNLHQQHLINSQSIKTPTHIYIYISNFRPSDMAVMAVLSNNIVTLNKVSRWLI
jgi:hypothetical protein